MARKKQLNRTRKKNLNRKRRRKVEKRKQQEQKNKKVFREVLDWFAVKGELFTKNQFHGNTKWTPEHLVGAGSLTG